MAEEEKIDRKPSGSRIRGMSLYASSADYERRLSEDIPQAPETEVVEETQRQAAGRSHEVAQTTRRGR
jgi:hypothetical protein